MKSNGNKSIIRKVFNWFDMFKAPAILRAKGEPQVSRLCPGVLSVLIFVLFIYILIAQIIQLSNYEQVTSSTIYQTETDVHLPEQENISVAISPAWEWYQYWNQLFIVQAYNIIANVSAAQDINIPLSLKPCEAKKWENFQQTFDYFLKDKSLCIENPEKVKLKGTIFNNQTYLYFHILKNNSFVGDFNQKLEELYKKKTNFFSVYLLDSKINTLKQDPAQQFIPLTYKYYYSNTTMMSINIYLGTYIVETDYSIIPILEDKRIETGYYISQVVPSYKQRQLNGQQVRQQFGVFRIMMSTDRIKYVREIGKIDQILSYVGGLMGLIIAFISVFVYSYNKFSYEILVAQHSFNYSESGSKARLRDFNFLKYLKYQLYDWLSLLRLKLNWNDCQIIYQTKDEANLYLDVHYLFRRMRLIDLTLQRLVPQKQAKLLNLTEPPCLKQVETKRRYLQYYNNIIQGEAAVNIEDLENQILAENQINSLARQKKMSTESADYILNSQKLISSDQNIRNIESIQSVQSIGTQGKQDVFEKQIRQNLQIHEDAIIKKMVKYKQLQQQSENMKINPQLKQTQKGFAISYMNSNDETRMSILNKIPLKILFRINKCIREYKQFVGNQNKLKIEENQNLQLQLPQIIPNQI